MPNYNIQEIYEEMEDNLIRSMKRNLGRHMDWENTEGFEWEQWQAKKLREIRKFQRRNKQLAAVSRRKWKGFVQENLKKQFLEGGSKVDKEFSSAIKRGFSLRRGTPSDDFFEGENNKIKNLIKAVNDDFDKASYAALRKMDDVYRQTIFKAGMFGSSGVMTVNQAIDMATKDFLAKGIDCIVYKNGAKVNIASYASMAGRTANKRAHLMGEGERRKDWGETLVLVSQYMQCSPLCLPWQGKVYIDDVYSNGKPEDGDYPLLSTAIKGHLFHPNCRHTMSTYFEGINEVPEPLRNESGEAYEKAQEIANAKRQARKYERLKNGSLDPENIKKYKVKEQEWKDKITKLANFKTGDKSSKGYVEAKRPLSNFRALSNDKVVNTLRKDSKEWIEGLTDEEIKAIKKYTYNSGDKKSDRFFERINAMLRGDIKNTRTLQEYASTISGSLRKNKLKHDIICYRSIDKDIYKDKAIGAIFREKQFVSTSVIESGALNKPFKVIIYAKKGTNAGYIEEISNFKKQRELLLDRDTLFRVISKKESVIELEVL